MAKRVDLRTPLCRSFCNVFVGDVARCVEVSRCWYRGANVLINLTGGTRPATRLGVSVDMCLFSLAVERLAADQCIYPRAPQYALASAEDACGLWLKLCGHSYLHFATKAYGSPPLTHWCLHPMCTKAVKAPMSLLSRWRFRLQHGFRDAWQPND